MQTSSKSTIVGVEVELQKPQTLSKPPNSPESLGYHSDSDVSEDGVHNISHQLKIIKTEDLHATSPSPTRDCIDPTDDESSPDEYTGRQFIIILF